MTIKDRSESDRICFDETGGIERLIEIMARLRDPKGGCPWDIEQTYQTIAPYTIEEAYEVADAIEREAWDELEGELGDLLLQVIYYAQMGREEGRFDFQSIANRIGTKMLNRHPHVFGDEIGEKSAAQQVQDWEKIKEAERGTQDQTGALDGVAGNLPALLRAYKLQNRAGRVGFDWPETAPVLAKIKEEIAELEEAIQDQDQMNMLEEYGDLLFAFVNLGRHLKIEPEAALRAGNQKFEKRFKAMEALATEKGQIFAELDLEAQEALWQKVKRNKD